jgi:outer membrane protein OmpA-like peptidoglycan-associated protein
MKIQTLTILACAISLFAQEAPVAVLVAPVAAPVAEPVAVSQFSCEASFEAIKNTYPRDAAANRIYAMVNARVVALKGVAKENRKGANYESELKTCDLSVELLKTQLSNAAYRKSLDSLTQKKTDLQKDISVVKDSIIDLLSKDASSINAALNNERNRLKAISEKEARLEEELARKNKAIAEKDSLIAAQKIEADKKLEALQSKTISVYKDARGTILSMSDILFETGKAELKPELKENLAEIAAILKSLLSESSVTLEGHTDNVGGEQINKFLSEQRANAVLNYLVERGVDRNRLKSVGYGLSRPVADNNTEEGRAKNRRVELVIKD